MVDNEVPFTRLLDRGLGGFAILEIMVELAFKKIDVHMKCLYKSIS